MSASIFNIAIANIQTLYKYEQTIYNKVQKGDQNK